MAKHVFDENYWCTRCGCGVVHVEEKIVGHECHATENVTAITHIVRGNRLSATVDTMVESKDRKP